MKRGIEKNLIESTNTPSATHEDRALELKGQTVKQLASADQFRKSLSHFFQIRKSLATIGFSICKITNRIRWKLAGEAGTVESALTMIPLLLLFLSILQISASVLGRTTELTSVQDQLTKSSLFRNTSISNLTNFPTNPINGSSESTLENLPLPGGGSLLIEKRKGKVPVLTPLLIGNDSFVTAGITVNENG